MTDTETDRVPIFAALSMMERKYPPLKYGRPPYSRPPVTPPSEHILIPAWNWYSVHGIPEDAQTLTLDANGMYLGAIGGCDIAHSQLAHTGAWETLPEPRKVDPGYYLIHVPYWAFDGTIVSPLGDSSRLQTEETVWIAAPTLTLLLELVEENTLGHVEVIDSWTTTIRTNFRNWITGLKEVRTGLLDSIDAAQTGAAHEALKERYDAFKEGYSSALSMMLTGTKCKTHRPDWAHTVYAQAAAAQWRKAWRYTATGHQLVRMGDTDEITILAADLGEVMSRAKPPFRVDPSGRDLGAMKPKKPRPVPPGQRTQRATDVPLVLEDDGDIL